MFHYWDGVPHPPHTHTHKIEPTQHCFSVRILLLLSYNLLLAPQSWGFNIPYSQMTEDKKAVPSFFNPQTTWPIMPGLLQNSQRIATFCCTVSACILTYQQDGEAWNWGKNANCICLEHQTHIKIYHSCQFRLFVCGPNAEHKQYKKIYCSNRQ